MQKCSKLEYKHKKCVFNFLLSEVSSKPNVIYAHVEIEQIFRKNCMVLLYAT